MLSNYLTLALRNLRKNSLYSGLNIVGLAIGIAACLLIVLYVTHEVSYDRWNPNAERIVRPVGDINFGGHHFELAVTGSIMAPEAGAELPEIQSWCRFRHNGSFLVKREGPSQQNIREENVLHVDSTFFELFPLKMIQGDPMRCLAQPNTMAISRSRAERYFSAPQMAIGQTLILENSERWQVTAVYEDIPVHSHFQADLLLSLNGNEEIKNSPPFWGSNNNFQTYFLLRKGTNLESFRQKFAALSSEKVEVTAQQVLGTTMAEIEKTGQFVRYSLQNLTDIHLHSDLTGELAPNGSIRYVWIFSAIAAFILLIACINFMNLATARSSGRAKEVGVRKVMGGRRSALIGQFLSESLVISAFAVVLAIVIAAIAMPWYRDLTGVDLKMPWSSPLFWAAMAGGTAVVGLLAGSYPAFFLSAFDAIRVLKGQVRGIGRGSGFRSVLVVFQFTVSVALIISTLLVFKQLNYIQNKKLGFEKNQVIILDDAYALGDKIYTLKEEMLRYPGIESATVSGFLPVSSNRSDYGFSKVRGLDKDNSVNMQRWQIDNDYFKTMNMEIVQGRAFDPARVTDSMGIIINETAARQFGFADPIGQKVYFLDGNLRQSPQPEDFKELHIVGVVRDFHWSSLRENIGSLCFQLGKSRGLASFRYKGAETASIIAALEKNWKALSPDQPFSYRFLDESFAKMYDAEQRVGKIAGIFGLLSILVSCLGLFGLAAFTTEQRTKEIGIRKVLGASVSSVVGLLSRDFLKLIFVALVIATPLAYYFMKTWLSDFAYRIDISWWVFVLAGSMAILVAFLTVGYQSVKAALANPVSSLRNE